MNNELATQNDLSLLKEQALVALKSGLLPRGIDSAEKAITIAIKGRELGLTPMNAFSHINIINGKPTISAELMLSLIYKNCPGAIVNYLETSSLKCVISAKRPHHMFSKFSYTIEEAKQAGLLGKDSWKNYPAAMLRARAVSIVARAVFPDSIMGCSYIHEELGAEVNEEGEIIESCVIKSNDFENNDSNFDLVNKKDIAREIKEIAAKIGMDNAAIGDLAIELSGHSAKEMTIQEMNELLENLEVRLGSAKRL